MKIIPWNSLQHVTRRLRQNPLYLGISVKVLEEENHGVSVVRIASNSPLAGKLDLGDSILKVNGNPIVRSEDLLNIIMMSPEQVAFSVKSNGQEKTVYAEL